MTYKEFYTLLKDNGLISSIWEYILDLIANELGDAEKKDDILKAFAIYSSLIDDGNICMSLDENTLKDKWAGKVNARELLLSEKEDYDDTGIKSIRVESEKIIKNEILSSINDTDLPSAIGDRKFFKTEDGWLYLKKYYNARKGIGSVIDDLFSYRGGTASAFKLSDCLEDGFSLSKGQEDAVNYGFNKNLLITGGPGTGKTTSILFLLLNLLSDSTDYDIYLCAPSGKAASRMKESIISSLNLVTGSFKDSHPDILLMIDSLQEYTIHRLLGHDFDTGGFARNKEHRFGEKSIFIIDEASMIDVCLFNSLLQAIPKGARLFIMGDRNQLPSVECGAVFGDLLDRDSLKDNIIRLDESKRFGEDTGIFRLAKAINENTVLPVAKEDWKSYTEFEIMEPDPRKPIFYFNDSDEEEAAACGRRPKPEKDIIESIADRWGAEFYKSLQEKATGIDYDNKAFLKELFDMTQKAVILSAQNEGVRGVANINRIIKKAFINTEADTSVLGYYAGQLMMITKNNRALDLYNGETGILVTLKDDPDCTLYFMIRKKSAIVADDGLVKDKIFKLGDYVFYPFRMITRDDIIPAYAITIHKSQGSDYENILVILPKKQGHPLLNRQIIYTAITRTKGNTYILSNQDRLEEAKERKIIRDTNLS